MPPTAPTPFSGRGQPAAPEPTPQPADEAADGSIHPPKEPLPVSSLVVSRFVQTRGSVRDTIQPLFRRAGQWLLHGVLGSVIEAVLPADCPACEMPLPGISRKGLCSRCWDGISPLEGPFCPRCGIPSSTFAGETLTEDRAIRNQADSLSLSSSLTSRPCGRCLARPPAYDAARCALAYEGAVRTLLHLFKFDRRRDLAGFLANAMIATALPSGETFDAVVPVPLHWTRRLQRGYNQAALLARPIARATHTRYAGRLLVKRRRTLDQSALDAAARRKNLRGTFGLRASLRSSVRPPSPHSPALRLRPLLRNAFRPSTLLRVAIGRDSFLWGELNSVATLCSPMLTGLRVLLVDDILTTGSTAEECARVLKRAGAGRVFVVAVARTPLPGSPPATLNRRAGAGSQA